MAPLDRNLRRYADVLEAGVGRPLRDVPGAGAAGGTTFGLLAIADRFASFEVRPGIEVVMELTDFADELAEADLVLTGEGRVDAQTAYGKTALGVAERARAAGVPVICFGGGVTPEGSAVMADLGALTMPVIERPMSLDEVRRRWRRDRSVARRSGRPGSSTWVRAVDRLKRRPRHREPDAGPAARRPRRRADPIRPWARRLRKSRPGLVEFVLERLAETLRTPRSGSASTTRPRSWCSRSSPRTRPT